MHSTSAPANDTNRFGSWRTDDFGLPCFDLAVRDDEHPYAPFSHLLATGRLSSLADRWGCMSLFTTSGGRGFCTISANRHQCSSGLYAVLCTADGERHSLITGSLENRRVRYAVGAVEWEAETVCAGTRLRIVQEVAAPPDGSPFMVARFTLEHLAGPALTGELHVVCDCTLVDRYHAPILQTVQGGPWWSVLPVGGEHPGLGEIFIVGAGEGGWLPGPASTVGFRLGRACEMRPGQRVQLGTAVGFGGAQARERARAAAALGPEAARRAWAERLAAVRLPVPEAWMQAESVWTLGQFLSFLSHDSALDEFYPSLGGYGWTGFNIREVAEDLLVLSRWWPDLALGTARWLAKAQHSCGDLPNGVPFAPWSDKELAAPEAPESSDTEIWLLLGLAALGKADPAALDVRVPYRDGKDATLWEHAEAAFHWVRDRVGVGSHGLIRFCLGDWNDYLFPMGREGRGESMMNTGMAARACADLEPLARARGRTAMAGDCARFAAELRAAGGRAWEGGWFVRGYTDAGRPVGSTADDRLFLDAQCWAALGGLGTPEQRRSALGEAVRRCRDPRGLRLLSRAFPCPPPPGVSTLPIPPGEGENGGVWPQVAGWSLWALAECGMAEEAMMIWKDMALLPAPARFPETPFGIFNGPDAYNSLLAGRRAHWTQVQMWDRRIHTPMNPSVAWQAFALDRILAAQAAG
jgi:hypothetical protein